MRVLVEESKNSEDIIIKSDCAHSWTMSRIRQMDGSEDIWIETILSHGEIKWEQQDGGSPIKHTVLGGSVIRGSNGTVVGRSTCRVGSPPDDLATASWLVTVVQGIVKRQS